MDIAARKRGELKQLFPEVFTETRNGKGTVVEAIDFERLKAALGEVSEVLERQRERYGMVWPGKNDCQKLIQQPSLATLKPVREESVRFDETENLFIEGDNLEVLKLLQKSYYGKVKMIYIDPPYNTGNDFVYPDDYSETLETYLKYAGLSDNVGKRWESKINSKDSGRFHTQWMNLMYPRLYLARNLLRNDGIILISIDENELENLLILGGMVFGKENHIENFVFDKKSAAKGVPPFSMVVGVHEYIVAYGKSEFSKFVGKERSKEGFNNPDDDPRGIWRNTNCKSTVKDKSEAFEIIDPATGNTFMDTWAHSKTEMERMANDGTLIFPRTPEGQVRKKEFFKSFKNENTPIKSSLGLYDAQANTQRVQALMGGRLFQNVKHKGLLEDVVRFAICSDNEDIILDFFAGSCTTAHAVLDLNKEDGGNRKFIMVQLPELCPKDSEAAKAGYKTIADIGKERIRRVIKNIESEQEGMLDLDSKPKLDLGFKVFKLDRSNFKVWDSEPKKDTETVKRQIELHIDHIDPKATQEDILYELLLKAGFPLTTKIEKRWMAGKDVFAIEDGALLICLEKRLTPDLIRAMADANPLQVICLDEGFQGNDQLKTNAAQIFKSRSQGESEHQQIVFRTV